MRKVYLCHPLRGAVAENIESVNKAARAIALRGDVPIVPHHIALYLDDNSEPEREKGMTIGMELLKLCDALVICSDTITSGMAGEIDYCLANGIPVITNVGDIWQ